MVLDAEDHGDVSETGPAVFCIRCGYNLFHLPPGECPECGSPFDPEDLRTIKTQNSADRFSLRRNGWRIAGYCFTWFWLIMIICYLAIALLEIAGLVYLWFTNQ